MEKSGDLKLLMSIPKSLKTSSINSNKNLIKIKVHQEDKGKSKKDLIVMMHLSSADTTIAMMKKMIRIKKIRLMVTFHLRNKNNYQMKWKIKFTKKNYKHLKCTKYYKKRKRIEKVIQNNHNIATNRLAEYYKIKHMKIITSYPVNNTCQTIICKAVLKNLILLKMNKNKK